MFDDVQFQKRFVQRQLVFVNPFGTPHGVVKSHDSSGSRHRVPGDGMNVCVQVFVPASTPRWFPVGVGQPANARLIEIAANNEIAPRFGIECEH